MLVIKFNGQTFTKRLLVHKMWKVFFFNFYRGHFKVVSKYNTGLRSLEFYGNLVYKFRKIEGKTRIF